ncbi:MAG: T9SS type A sorting domain-containing protein [Ignavibacteriaceae bacterium]|nr:T9SS type A sorting domain-containing protein [Ignavibacteriaceae bacterium]
MAIIRLLIICILLTTSAIPQGLRSYQKTMPIKTETFNVKLISDTTISGDTLRQNQEWSGNITVTGEIVVPDSITLTIDHGTNIYFSNNTSLKIMNGTILTSWSNQPDIIFRYNDSLENRGYIIFDGLPANGGMYENYGFNIIKGGGIQYLNNAYCGLHYSILDSCWEGIYLYNTSGCYISFVTIRDPQQNGIVGQNNNNCWIISSEIIKTSSNSNYQNYQGIFLGDMSSGIVQVDISGFCWGIYLGSWSWMYSDLSESNNQTQNNRLRNNEVGIGVGWGSYLDAGYDYSFNKNSIYNNLYYDIFSYTGSVANISGNYWGGGPLTKYYCDSTSFIFGGDDYLVNDPWDTLLNKSKIKNNIKNNRDYSQFNIKEFEKQGNKGEEISYYKSIVKKGNNSQFALSQLCRINRETPTNALSDYFRSLLKIDNKNHPLIQKIVADDNLHKNEFKEAMLGYDNIIAENSNEFMGIDSRFEKLFAYLHIKHDTLKARELLSEIKAIGSIDVEVGMRTKIAENLLYKNNYSTTGKTKEVPVDYLLSQNYPNPFNPSTTIKYQIPESGMVSLKIYDILGREVANLVNEYKNQGKYDINFNASKLASGVYIYQFRVNDYVSSKKMILLK